MLVVNLLGPPQVSIDGLPIVVDTRKAIALLAYLAVEGSASRDTLAGLFWGESSQERARATLRRTLSVLRGATGTDLIAADRNRVWLAGQISSDLDAVNRELEATTGHGHEPGDVCSRCIPHLRRATDLYRGEFLQGFALRTSPEFEDWARSVTESMRARISGAFNRLGTALAATGEYQAAIAAVNRWIDLDRLHEPAHRFLMLLHAWAGDRPGAIDAYRQCVTTLDRELGVPPLEETTELHEAILDEDLPRAPGVRRRVKAETSPRPTVGTDLIDRESELDILRQALLPGPDGGGRIMALTAAAWMGKTRLLEELVAETGGDDRDVLLGRAFQTEHALPYGVVTQVLRSARSRIEGLGDDLPGWVTAEVGRLLPEIGGTEPAADRFGELRLMGGVYALLSAMARSRPVLIIVDDAQWVDGPSAAVLSHVARRVAADPISMIVAVRSGENLDPAMAEIVAGADDTVTIPPLADRHLLPLVDGDEEAARSLRDRTGGAPLLVAEALTADAAPGSETPGMARYMDARLRETGDLARQILTAAAVLNGVCDAGLLRDTSGRSEEEVVEAVEELMAAGILREVPGSDALAFTLDAMQRVAHESISMVRRRLLHRRAARALQERGRSRSDPGLAAAVAAHHQAAGDPEAFDWYHLAADLARGVYAHDSARQFYETALALGDPDLAGIHLGLGELAMVTGDYAAARRQLTLAASHAEPPVSGVVEHRRGEVERLLGRFAEAEAHFERALESHPVPADVLADWALLAHRTGDTERAVELAERAWSEVEPEGEPAIVSRVRNILAVVSPDPGESLAYAESAIDLAGEDPLLRMAAMNNKALLLAETGKIEEAVALVEEAIGIADRTGHRHREAALWDHLADLHHRAGREEESQATLTRAVSLFADIDTGEPEVWLLARW